MAVGAPNPDKVAALGLPRPSYEGSGEGGAFSPADLRSAYKLPSEGGEGQTVAITIAYDDPNAEADLAVYRAHYGLSACTTANGCFKKVNQKGEAANYPEPESGWAIETSLDLDMVSAACPKCHILLVEADSNEFSDLGPAVEEAAKLGATAISNSWAGEQYAGETAENHYFNHPGIPTLFASGDWGYGVYYPASSPDVIAVGGTSLKKAENARGWSETAWSGAGSGCSAYQTKPSWQTDEGCAKRTLTDVSAVSDPATPVSIYDSYNFPGWSAIGGTSAATPLMAGVEVLSSSAFRAAGPSAFTRAGKAGGLFDVLAGDNGACSGYLCIAEAGYDGPTGWGTPNGPLAMPVAITETATAESSAKAKLSGSINPGGLATTYHFEYGTTTSYGTKAPVPDASAGSGSEYTSVSRTIEGLSGKTLYHYRLVATNSGGTFYGNDRTFGTTPPAATTGTASEIHANDATLKGTVNPEGLATSYYFEFGAGTSYGRRAPVAATEIGSGTTNVTASTVAPVLTGNMTYHFRLVAKSPAGTSYGKDETFTTPQADWLAQRIPKPAENPDPGSDPYQNTLTSVSCVSTSDCMAVGDYLNYVEQMNSRHWNGTTWTENAMAVPPNSTEKFIGDVSCSSSTFCVAVGFYGTLVGEEREGHPLIERWDGSKWTADPVSLPEGIHEESINGASLEGISCASATSCLAVGRYYKIGEAPELRPLVYRWNGTEWSNLTMSSPPNSDLQFFAEAVSCATATWCMVTGAHVGTALGWYQPVAEVWNGSGWTIVQSESPEPLKEATYPRSVSCPAVNSCSVLTYNLDYALHREKTPPAEHWNGSTWTREALPQAIGSEHGEPRDISCPSSNACTAVGESWVKGGYAPVAYSWNGSTWSLQTTSEPTGEEEGPLVAWGGLSGTSCPLTTVCVAVGNDMSQSHEQGGVIQTYQKPPTVTTEAGSNVKHVEATLNGSVNPNGGETKYYFEYGLTTSYGSKTPETSAGSGTSSAKVSRTVTELEPGTAYHVRLVASNAGGVSKGADQVVTTTGWDLQSSPNPEGTTESALESMSCMSSTLCESVGNYKNGSGLVSTLAERWNGSAWTIQTTPNPEGGKANKLEGISCTSASACMAVGSYENSSGTVVPLVEHWDGSSWTIQAAGIPAGAQETRLYGVSCAEATSCIAAGFYKNSSGVIVALSELLKGGAWSPLTANSPMGAKMSKLVGISCTTANACEATGYYENSSGVRLPLAEHWAGGWTLQTAPSPEGAKNAYLFGVSCTATSACTTTGFYENASGAAVALAERWDGTSWTIQSTPTPEGTQASWLLWVSCPSSTSCTAVGEYEHSFTITPIAEHWDGTSWTVQSVPSPEGAKEGSLGAISCPSTVACAASGNYMNSSGVKLSLTETFGGFPPTVTNSATGVTATSASLNATINPNGRSTEYFFEYGLTGSYGSNVPVPSESAGAGTEAVSKSSVIGNLQPETTYHFRVVATNSEGTVHGKDETFTTGSVPTPTYSSAFGSTGTGNGQFSHPSDVALDTGGNLWVIDEFNRRVEKFNEKGEYLSQFGSLGSGNGQFSLPTGLAFDSKGNLWVLDLKNNRVQKFNEKGEYISQFGSVGSGNGQFSLAEGLAIDAKNNIWVADTGNNRVQKFNEKGEFVKAFGSKGSGNGQFTEPRGIDVGPSGNVWVADYGNNRVEKFNEAGEYVSQFGVKGTGNGQFEHPVGLAVEANGVIWVADRGNNRVEAFSEGGSYLAKFGAKGSGAGQFGLETPVGIATDSRGGLWITDTGNNRVQKWLVTKDAYYSSAFGSKGTGNGQFEHPADVARDSSGNLWVSDQFHGRIEKFNEKGEYVSQFGTVGSGNGQFSWPTGIVFDSKGNLWVLDSKNNRVQKFNEKGEYLSKFGSFGTGNGQFSTSEGLAVDSKDNIWVADTGNNRVQKFNEKGEFVKAFGSKGSGNGQFTEPRGIDVGPSGNVWVADYGNNRVEKFNEAGEYVSQFGVKGTGNGQFEHPAGLAVEANGTIWVADRGNNRVEGFSEAGSYLFQFGAKGSGLGQFGLETPVGIATDSKGALWITDTGNNRVQKWTH